MSDITTDPHDPRLTRGGDAGPTPQAEAYLVLSDEERAKGFIRPVRRTYVHLSTKDGSPLPKVITHEDRKNLRGCGTATTMSQAIAETYARDPKFYGFTYCVGCGRHIDVNQFTWDDGSVVGS